MFWEWKIINMDKFELKDLLDELIKYIHAEIEWLEMEDFNPHYNFRRMIAIVEEIKEAFKVDDKYLEKKDFENYLKILTEEYEKNKKK